MSRQKRTTSWKGLVLTAVLLVCSPAVSALATDAPTISVETDAMVEVKTVNEKGEEEIQRVPAEKVMPGERVIYVTVITNHTASAAENVVIAIPVEANTTYVDGSASTAGAKLTYSVDGGSSYAAPEQLTIVEADGTERPATAADYTNIRWELTEPLQPETQKQVESQVTVK